MIVQERGPWKAGETEDEDRAFVASDDFTHDVRLYVNGDFGTKADRLEYAREIAKRLNAYRPSYEAHSCERICTAIQAMTNVNEIETSVEELWECIESFSKSDGVQPGMIFGTTLLGRVEQRKDKYGFLHSVIPTWIKEGAKKHGLYVSHADFRSNTYYFRVSGRG